MLSDPPRPDNTALSRRSALHVMDSQNSTLFNFAQLSSSSEWSFHLVPDKTRSQRNGSMDL